MEGKRDILDRDKPRPIKVTGDDTATWVIVAVSVIIIVIFWGIVLYFAVDSVPAIKTAAQSGGGILVSCPPGQCATNIYSGEKRCPPVTGTIVSDAQVEVCSSQFICDNPLLPYAVQSDQSTNQQGICETGVTCRCLSQVQCPEYVTSYFETVNGNPYVSLTGQRTQFSQSDVTQNLQTKSFSNNTPLQLTSPSIQFCTVPLLWLNRTSPGCTDESTMDATTIVNCMGGPNGCSGISYNPCIRGTLAFITDDSDAFDSTYVQRVPLACVAGEPPPCGKVAIYDTNYGGLVYKTI